MTATNPPKPHPSDGLSREDLIRIIDRFRNLGLVSIERADDGSADDLYLAYRDGARLRQDRHTFWRRVKRWYGGGM